MAIGTFSLRQMFSRLGRGNLARDHSIEASTSIYMDGGEIVSVRETIQRHAGQDGSKSNTSSVRRWVETHCDPMSYATVWRERDFRDRVVAETWPDWNAVTTEKSHFISGLQHYSRVTYTDFPSNHETRDWNWDMLPSPHCMYLLTDHQTGLNVGQSKKVKIHNEWESGSMPLQWRPFWGEFVTCWGRHIWDQGHPPYSCEIHPGHTIVRERTTAGPVGNHNARVPVTQASIGMGLSGGFTGEEDARWNDEFGGIPNGVWGDTTDCWPTNLKKHPLAHRVFPPVPRPSETAVLRWRIVFAEIITVNGGGQLDDFLERCQHDDPAEGGGDLAFRLWSRSHNYPRGFTPTVAAHAQRPTFAPVYDNQGRVAAFDVNVDLSGVGGIPVGYYAMVEVGWSERGNHTLREWELTFESVRADETDEWYDDWHMYFGVNGQWAAWWTDDHIEEDDSYTHNRAFRFWTVDDMPIVIRDCGVEWDGTDPFNEKLDRVEITADGPHYFDAVSGSAGVTVLSRNNSTNTLRFKARGTVSGDTKHTWTMKLRRLS